MLKLKQNNSKKHTVKIGDVKTLFNQFQSSSDVKMTLQRSSSPNCQDEEAEGSKVSVLDMQEEKQHKEQASRPQSNCSRVDSHNNRPFKTEDDVSTNCKSKSKNMLPTSPKIIKKNRNLTKLPLEHEYKGMLSMGFGEDGLIKGHMQQMSVRMSKSFNNSSFTMNGHGNQTTQHEHTAAANGDKNGGPTQSNFRSSGQLVLSLSMSGSLISPSATCENATHDNLESQDIKVTLQSDAKCSETGRKINQDLEMPMEIHKQRDDNSVITNDSHQVDESQIIRMQSPRETQPILSIRQKSPMKKPNLQIQTPVTPNTPAMSTKSPHDQMNKHVNSQEISKSAASCKTPKPVINLDALKQQLVSKNNQMPTENSVKPTPSKKNLKLFLTRKESATATLPTKKIQKKSFLKQQITGLITKDLNQS